MNCNSSNISSEFHKNSAKYGGVLHSSSSNIMIEASEFHNSSATYQGGVLYVPRVAPLQ